MSTRVTSHDISNSSPLESKKKLNPIDYVSQQWLPVSESVLYSIKHKFDDGEYLNNPKNLLLDLKTDVGLFSWFLKNLPKLITNTDTSITPTLIIENIDLSKCDELFKSASLEQFPHRIQGAMKIQSSSIKHAVISAITAETVASHSGLEPELAHLCATIRQVGINLVAWNYPSIFSRAIANVSDNIEGLEKELFRFIGHTPTTLASNICLEWDQDESIKSYIIPATPDSESKNSAERETLSIQEREEKQDKLNNCLELGNSMALLSDPEHFPGYAKNWQNTVERLQQAMGQNAINNIQERLAGFSKVYSNNDFDFNIDLEPKKNLTRTSIFRVTDRLMSGNPWIAKCSENLRSKFHKIYSSIDKRGISTEAISLLISELIPILGFVRGCIYKFDEKKMRLLPILRIGETQLETFEVLRCDSGKFMKHPAVIATCYHTPIVQEEIFINSELVSTIAGIFGDNKKKAVVYVELSKQSKPDKNLTLLHFKAIQKTLADCLNFD